VPTQEFCNGGSLRDAVAKGHFTVDNMPQRWGPIMKVLTDVVSGMHYLQRRRICHGDLNPANIMFKVRPPPCIHACVPCMCAGCSSGLLQPNHARCARHALMSGMHAVRLEPVAIHSAGAGSVRV
jgi:serine/threonine protein kinase